MDLCGCCRNLFRRNNIRLKRTYPLFYSGYERVIPYNVVEIKVSFNFGCFLIYVEFIAVCAIYTLFNPIWIARNALFMECMFVIALIIKVILLDIFMAYNTFGVNSYFGYRCYMMD